MRDSTQILKLFEEAVSLAPAERDAFIDEVRASDSRLGARISALLQAYISADDFLEVPAQLEPHINATVDIPPSPQTAATEEYTNASGLEGKCIGRYKLLQQVGEGGMGTVYMAEQSEPVKRRVALKIVKAGLNSRQVLARFEAERQALALMNHPNIAQAYDAGTTSTGSPYFVMELIKGIPITQYCDDHQLSPRERLELFLPVCHAVQHAHQKGIIHRDIKPSNILVAEYDNHPVPKIIDFGIAKALTENLTERTLYTGIGQIIGTLEYMSPEQARVNQLDVDTRSDIYSLGVLLYELLVGSTPLDRQRLRSVALDEMLRLIREEEPAKPSNRLSSVDTAADVAVKRKSLPKTLISALRGELDWIIMRALEKDRNRRYQTANGFAMDIQRYLSNEPVQACPPSAAYRFKKLATRNRGLLAASSLILAMLVLGLTGTSWQTYRAIIAERDAREAADSEKNSRVLAQESERQARDNENKAKENAEQSQAMLDFLVGDILTQAGARGQERLNQAPDPNLTVREALERAEASVGERFKDKPKLEFSLRTVIASMFIELGVYYKAVAQLEAAKTFVNSLYSEDSVEYLNLCEDLGYAYAQNNDPKKSIDCLEPLLRKRLANLGSNHPDTIRTYTRLGVAFQIGSDLTRAKQILEEGLKCEQTSDTQAALCDLKFALAKVYCRQQAYRMCLDIFEDLANDPDFMKDPSLLETQDHAKALSGLGMHDKAIAIAEKNERGRIDTLGTSNLNTINAIGDLLRCLKNAGRFDEAYKHAISVHERIVAQHGENSFAAQQTGLFVAQTLVDLGKDQEAIELLENLRKLNLAIFGPEQPVTLDTQNELAVAYYRIGLYKKAIPLFEGLSEVFMRMRGAEHQDTLRVRYDLALNQIAAEDYENGLRLLEELKPYETHPDPAKKASFLLLKGLAQLEVGYFADAQASLTECYKIREQIYKDDFRLFNAMGMLGYAHFRQGQLEEATKLMREAADRMCSKPPQPTAPTALVESMKKTLSRTVELFTAMDQPEEAMKYKAKLEELDQLIEKRNQSFSK